MFANMALQGMLGNRVKGALPQIIGLRETKREPPAVQHGKRQRWKNIVYQVIDVNRPTEPPLASVELFRKGRTAYVAYFSEGPYRQSIKHHVRPPEEPFLKPKQIRDMLRAFFYANPEFDYVEGGRIYGRGRTRKRTRLSQTSSGHYTKQQKIRALPLKKKMPTIQKRGEHAKKHKEKVRAAQRAFMHYDWNF